MTSPMGTYPPGKERRAGTVADAPGEGVVSSMPSRGIGVPSTTLLRLSAGSCVPPGTLSAASPSEACWECLLISKEGGEGDVSGRKATRGALARMPDSSAVSMSEYAPVEDRLPADFPLALSTNPLSPQDRI